MKNLHTKFSTAVIFTIIMILIPLASPGAELKEGLTVEGLVGGITLKGVNLAVEQVDALPAYPQLGGDKGILMHATGEATLHCNGDVLCLKQDADGMQVGLDIGIALSADSSAETGLGARPRFRAQTAGQMTKVRVFSWDDKQSGASLVKQGGSTQFLLNIEGNAGRCGKVFFNLASINIDHTSAGIVLQDLKGSAWLSIDQSCLYDIGADMEIKLGGMEDILGGVRTNLITVFDVFEDEDKDVASFMKLADTIILSLDDALSITSELMDWAIACSDGENDCQLNHMRMPLMQILQDVKIARTALADVVIYTGHAGYDTTYSAAKAAAQTLDTVTAVVQKALRAQLSPDKTLSETWWK